MGVGILSLLASWDCREEPTGLKTVGKLSEAGMSQRSNRRPWLLGQDRSHSDHKGSADTCAFSYHLQEGTGLCAGVREGGQVISFLGTHNTKRWGRSPVRLLVESRSVTLGVTVQSLVQLLTLELCRALRAEGAEPGAGLGLPTPPSKLPLGFSFPTCNLVADMGTYFQFSDPEMWQRAWHAIVLPKHQHLNGWERHLL